MDINTLTTVLKTNLYIKTTLDALWSNGRFPHAVMFEGEKGILPYSFGIYYALKAICKDNENSPCFKCSSCQKILKDCHQDIIFIDDEIKIKSKITGKMISQYAIENIREIRQRAFVIPMEGDRNVFIFKNADVMQEASQNALLKIIEEPPENSVFVFLCENSKAMLETILSRVTLFKINQPNIDDATEIISSTNENFSKEHIIDALKITSNNINSAMEILNGQDSSFIKAKKLYDALSKENSYTVLKLLKEITDNKLTKDVLNQLKLIIIRETANYIKDEYGIFSFTPLQATKFTDIIDSAILMHNQNVNANILLTYISSKFISVINYK